MVPVMRLSSRHAGSTTWTLAVSRRLIGRDNDLHPPVRRRGLLRGADGGAVDHLNVTLRAAVWRLAEALPFAIAPRG